MSSKELICPERRRQVPEGVGWVDHRLVRDGHFMNCGTGPLALYLFLITVGDRDGMSWYSDRSLSTNLDCDEQTIRNYRRSLKEAGLIAYRRPYYQVLDLSPFSYDTKTFSPLLRESVRRDAEENADRGKDECPMISPDYRLPDDYRPVKKLGAVISEMLEGGEKI